MERTYADAVHFAGIEYRFAEVAHELVEWAERLAIVG